MPGPLIGLAIRGAGIALRGAGKALKRQKDFQKKMKKKHPALKTKNIAAMQGAGTAASAVVAKGLTSKSNGAQGLEKRKKNRTGGR